MTKKIVILGAGKSSSYLIKYLYSKRLELDININIFQINTLIILMSLKV